MFNFQLLICGVVCCCCCCCHIYPSNKFAWKVHNLNVFCALGQVQILIHINTRTDFNMIQNFIAFINGTCIHSFHDSNKYSESSNCSNGLHWSWINIRDSMIHYWHTRIQYKNKVISIFENLFVHLYFPKKKISILKFPIITMPFRFDFRFEFDNSAWIIECA